MASRMLHVSIPSLGAIDEGSAYTPGNSPVRYAGAGASRRTQKPFATPMSGSSAEMDYSPAPEDGESDYPYSPSPGRTPGKTSKRFHTEEFDDESQDDNMMSSAIGNESDLDSGNESDASGEDEGRQRGWVNPDILYQDEFGYWLVKLLRGSTHGRKLKRCVFKIAIVGIVCSIALIIIAHLEAYLYSFSAYFNTSPYGATLQSLMLLAAWTEGLMSLLSLVFVKYWASAVTNRKLFIQLLRLYSIFQLVTAVIGIFMVAILYKTFSKVDRWQDDLTLATMFPYYLCTWLFSIPYIAVTLYYVLDISFYMDDLAKEVGAIEEENPPADRVDLSDVSFNQVMLLIVAFPVVIAIQFLDLIVALFEASCRYIEIRRKERRDLQKKRKEMLEKKIVEKTRGSSVWARAWRTAKRRWTSCYNLWTCTASKKPTLPALDTTLDSVPASPYAQVKPTPNQNQQVAASTAAPADAAEREVAERLARERATEEEERRHAIKAAEIKARLEAEAQRMRAQREEEEAFERDELARRIEDEKKDSAPTLDVPRFKALWTSLPTAGSFNAKLRALPSLSLLTEHMRKQGFHVVFASAPTMDECELGVCNIRERPSDKWFLARFLASPVDFSAVMKSEDPESAASFVKKFSLAKVLKIDTTRTQLPAGGGGGGSGASPNKSLQSSK